MIVKCEQCQTRFKIPDDKVTEKGVKVRCTKCSHTFRVTRDMAQPAAAPAVNSPPPATADPFARFGAPAELPHAEVTRPGVFALGVEATRPPDPNRRLSAPPPAQVPSFDFGSLTPPGASAPTVPAVPAFVPATAQAASPFDFAAISKSAGPPAPAVAPAPSSFDFSNFAAPTQPMPPLPAVRPVAPPIASLPAPPAYDFASVAPPPAAPQGFDFAQVAPPSSQAYDSAQAAPPASQGFDFAQVAPPSSQAYDYAQAAPPASEGFDFAQVAPPSSQAYDYAQPAPPASQGFDFAQVAPPAAPPAAAGSFDMGGLSQGAQSSAPMDHGAGSTDGFFGGSNDGGAAAARAMFDMPVPAAAPSSLLDVPAPEPEAPARAAEALVARRAPQVVAQPAPSTQEPARRRTVVGIVVNVAIAAVLVMGLVVVGSAFLNEGKLSSETLSFESLKNTFAPSVDFVANDVSNGLYETRAERSVFFVRGEVMNRSEASVKVVVKAEIVEDGKVVRFGESWAGEPATPEEIFLIDSSEALEALNRKVEKRSLVVPAGAAASFVVPFTEYPPDLKGFRVRVSARAVAVNPTAANP